MYGWADAMVRPILEWNVGTVVEITEVAVLEVEVSKAGARLEADVPYDGSTIWTDVSVMGTVLEFEVKGFDHVVMTGGNWYVVMTSSWLLKYPMLRSQSLSCIWSPLCAHQGT